MERYKFQNACTLICIILIDVVAYLLIGFLMMDDDWHVISSKNYLSITIYLWHGVNSILIAYLVFLGIKTIKKKRTKVKMSKSD